MTQSGGWVLSENNLVLFGIYFDISSVIKNNYCLWTSVIFCKDVDGEKSDIVIYVEEVYNIGVQKIIFIFKYQGNAVLMVLIQYLMVSLNSSILCNCTYYYQNYLHLF